MKHSPTLGNRINGQSRDELRFRNPLLDRESGREHEVFDAFHIRMTKKEKGAKAINQPTIDSTVVIEMCYRQTKALLPV